MKFLLSGFEPFGESPINPSQMLVESIAEDYDECQAVILPVDQERGPAALLSAVNEHNPEIVLAFGLAMGRPKISLERVALNLMDFRIPDNAGNQVYDQAVVQNGPVAYFFHPATKATLQCLIGKGYSGGNIPVCRFLPLQSNLLFTITRNKCPT